MGIIQTQMFNKETIEQNMFWLTLLTEHVKTINTELKKDMMLYMMTDLDQNKESKDPKDFLWLKMESYSNAKEVLEFKTHYRSKDLIANIEAMAYSILNSSTDIINSYKTMINHAN